MRGFRTFVVIFCIIWLIPANLLLARTSSTETVILGRYTLRFFLFLVAYWSIPVALLAYAFFIARPSHLKPLTRPFRWLQRYPVIFPVLVLGLIELWYFIQRALYENRFWGIGPEYQQFLLFVALMEVLLLGVLIFAGREGEELRNTALNVGLLVASMAVAFVLFSFGYTLIIKKNVYQARRDFAMILFQPDPILGVRPAANLVDAGIFLEEEDRYVKLSTDANGLRNSGDVHGAPIAAIGDSFVFGMNVEDSALWSNVMSQKLGVPVANYSSPGYQLWQYNILAEQYASKGGHQIVIYGIFANDLRVVEDTEEEKTVLKRRGIWPYWNPINYTIYTFLSESPVTQIINWLSSSPESQAAVTEINLEEEIPELPFDLYPICNPSSLYTGSDYENQLLVERLDTAIRLGEANGYRLLFVTIPTKETIYAEELLPYCPPGAGDTIYREQAGFKFICDYLESQGQLCYDMTDDFQAAADELGLIYFRLDGHWNPRGNEVFADLLIDYLNRHQLLEELSIQLADE